ncbi:unnamed protein product [Caenorhabditis angaria]|uniref:DUF19 domain-containing protein n=1 Tax=Caenorhabditis angaria TaxID=860376 RepID=A0A9P1I464_9PELO|nr:unnamed protein product [Caenorhabditis angaria]
MKFLIYIIIIVILCNHVFAIVVDSSICEAYKEVEKEFHCGSSGYPINYGYRYCMSFTSDKIRETFDNSGKSFIDCTTKCLIDKILTIAQKSKTCQQVQEKAFHSHVDCYLNCDFCKVCKTQKIPLMKSYDWSDFLSFDATHQVYSIVRKCGIFNCFM